MDSLSNDSLVLLGFSFAIPSALSLLAAYVYNWHISYHHSGKLARK
jgi:hypothetical protein